MPEISPLDYAFLALESGENPKHVAPVQILRPPEGAPADYVSRFVAKLRQRQPQPPFNYKLKLTVPNLLGGVLPGLPSTDLVLPQWREVSSVDMEQHVFHHKLPKPGSVEQLGKKIQALHETLLDRQRPMWECHVIEGYEGGQRFAVYIKIHHALADGALLAARLITHTGTEPDFESGIVFWALPGGAKKESEHSENLLDDVSHAAKYVVNSTNMLGNMYMSVLRSGVGALLQAGSTGKKETMPFSAPVTRLDQQPSAGRSLAFGKVSLAEVKSLAKATGATINDILLALVDMGVRRYLADFGEEPKKRMTALMPMSLRDKVDLSQANCVSLASILLGRANATPLERLREISKETVKVKDDRKLSPEMLVANSMVLAGLAQVGESLNLSGTISPLGNFTFSNIPGSREIRYHLDARIEEIYPVSCLAPGAYLNITVYSYCDYIHFQFIALKKAAPDLNDLARHVHDAVEVMAREVFAEPVSSEAEKSQASVKKPVAAAAASKKTVRTKKTTSSAVKKPKPKPKPKSKAAVKSSLVPVTSSANKKSIKSPAKAPASKKSGAVKSTKAALKKKVKSSAKAVAAPNKPVPDSVKATASKFKVPSGSTTTKS